MIHKINNFSKIKLNIEFQIDDSLLLDKLIKIKFLSLI